MLQSSIGSFILIRNDYVGQMVPAYTVSELFLKNDGFQQIDLI